MATAQLAAAADGWNNDPVFAPYYHDTGYIVAASSSSALEHLKNREIRHHASSFTPLNTAEEFRATMPRGGLDGRVHRLARILQEKRCRMGSRTKNACIGIQGGFPSRGEFHYRQSPGRGDGSGVL